MDGVTSGRAVGTRAGVGFSENPDSREAGIQAARAALADMGDRRPDLVLVFSTDKHDPAALRDGVRSAVGTRSRLIGGYSMGIITRDRLGYDGYQVGVAALSSDSIQMDMFIEEGLADNEYEVGLALGRQIRSRSYPGEMNLVLMYDAVKPAAPEGVPLNPATPLLAGLSHALGSWPPAAGIGMIGSMQFNPASQWFDDRVAHRSAMALILSGNVRMDTVVMHGCRPSGGYHTITRAEGNVLYEIDGKPALDVIDELLGPGSEKSWEDYPLFITLGVNKGDRFGEVREEDYVNRLVMAVDKDRRALVMAEAALRTGSEVQLMRRSVDLEYVGRRADELYERVRDRSPFFALYIDCAARASAYCDTDREDAEEVQRALGPRVPVLGVYSGFEIGKVGSDLEAMNFTGVLCIFSQ